MKQLTSLCLLIFSGLLAGNTWGFDHSHSQLSALLNQYVEDGRVDYRSLQSDRASLAGYLEELAAVTEAEVNTWEEPDQLAFWINAYNAATLMTIVEHYPLKRRGLKGLAFPSSSIWQIPGVWKKRTTLIASAERSLDDIEHNIIRVRYDEPRIHMALVCAAISCPQLRAEAYVGDRLDDQLTEQTRQFLTDRLNGLRVDESRQRVDVSRIFKWFGEDFIETDDDNLNRAGKESQAGLVDFLLRFAQQDASEALRNPAYSVGYLKYDWSLNEQS